MKIKDQQGFGLIEILFSLLLLSITFSAIHLMVIQNNKLVVGRGSEIIAKEELKHFEDSLRTVGFNGLQVTCSEEYNVDNVVSNPQYQKENVNVDISWYCLQKTGINIGLINITISWSQISGSEKGVLQQNFMVGQ